MRAALPQRQGRGSDAARGHDRHGHRARGGTGEGAGGGGRLTKAGEDGRSGAARGLPLAAGVALFLAGTFGRLGAGWGYGLLLASCLFLALAFAAGGVFLLTRWLDGAALIGACRTLLALGGWSYVLGVCALGGFFLDAAMKGEIAPHWMVFGPAAIAALVALDLGLYRVLVRNNRPTWQRWRGYVTRAASDPRAMRRALVDEVILQRPLLGASRFRWLRHTLIFWGFALMFALEIVAVFVREGMPAFGLPDVWRIPGHPVRLAFDLGYDLTGLAVLLGCVLALAYRVRVRGTEARRYTDTPTAAFLLIVVASGFALEALRIAHDGRAAYDAFAFVGYALAALVPPGAAPLAAPLWLAHALAACLFIAYVPARRLVHSCATPIGRLANSQTGLLAAKRAGVLRGLLAERRP